MEISFALEPRILIDQNYICDILRYVVEASEHALASDALEIRFNAVDHGHFLKPAAFRKLNQGRRAVNDLTGWIAGWKAVCALITRALVQVVIDGDGEVQARNVHVIGLDKLEHCLLPLGGWVDTSEHVLNLLCVCSLSCQHRPWLADPSARILHIKRLQVTIRAQEAVVIGITFACKSREAKEGTHVVESNVRDLRNQNINAFS